MSALGLGLIRPPGRAGASSERPSLLRELREGLAFLAGHPTLRRAQLSWTVYTAIGCAGVVTGLVFVGSAGGTGSPALASLAVAVYAGGSALGTTAAGWRQPVSPWLGIAGCLVALALGAVLIATGLPPAVLGGALLFGLGEGFFLVVFLTVRAQATPDRLMGRISAAGGLLSRVASAVGVAWMGLALQWLGGAGAFTLLAAMSLLLAAWTAARPRAVVDA